MQGAVKKYFLGMVTHPDAYIQIWDSDTRFALTVMKENGKRNGRQGMSYKVILKSNKSICPECSGMLIKQEPLKYRCVDCGLRLEVVGHGIFDNELEMENADKQGSLPV